MTTSGKVHRRSLKDRLKVILRRQQDDFDHLPTGSKVLNRTGSSLALLSAFDSISTLPDFDTSRSNESPATTTNHNEVQNAYFLQSGLRQLARSCIADASRSAKKTILHHPFDTANVASISSRGLLLPKMSLGQLITPDSVLFQSPLSQVANACNVPSIYRQGASLQASLATLDSPMRSASTLRLQRSAQDLKPTHLPQVALPPRREVAIWPPADSIPLSDIDRECFFKRTLTGNLLPGSSGPPSKASQRGSRSSELDAGLSSINHFSSFCVLDAAAPGYPVTATSQDLRSVFEIGEEFCLNTADLDGAEMDTVTGEDSEGNTVIHLVVYSPLLNPGSGRSRFVLASLLDITSFITDTASIPDLETISEESFVEEVLNTPPSRIHLQQSPRCEMTSDSLLGDSFLPDDPHAPVQTHKDIWLDIAIEETRKSRSIKSTSSTPRSNSTTSARSTNDILDSFLHSLQGLYSEFFLLGRSPLDECSYEICNVSPKVYAGREYIDGHLTKTAPADRSFLEEKLTREKPFRMRVRWGVAGDLKQIYCIPLFGRSNVTWVCFLVEEEKWAGLLWWE